MISMLNFLWAESCPARPDGVPVADRVAAFAVAALTLAEVFLRHDVVRPLEAAAGGLILAISIGFRTIAPFASFAAALSTASLIAIWGLVQGAPPAELYVGGAALLLPYSLVRWAAGKEALLGVPFLIAVYGLSCLDGSFKDLTEALGGALLLLLVVVVALAARLAARERARRTEHQKLREREQLARELHDTLAHHLAAVTIQAQAGGIALAKGTEGIAQVLSSIEKEAQLALGELRQMVGELRHSSATPLHTTSHVLDIRDLALRTSGKEQVTFELIGDSERLTKPIHAAIFRIAQESLTNARRHARQLRVIRIHVAVEDKFVHLTVKDDGNGAKMRTEGGFGLMGMAERAMLLGGTVEAGPQPEGGWQVSAAFPLPDRAS